MLRLLPPRRTHALRDVNVSTTTINDPTGNYRSGRLALAGRVPGVLRGRVGLSSVMVGRRGALDRLSGLVDAADVACGDGVQVALVAGEPGIGKTRLLRELIDHLPSDVTVVSAQAQPGSLGRSFDMVSQLCAPGLDPSDGAMQAVATADARGPVLLILEDLHWVDADSANVIEAIALRRWNHVVIVGTYRPTDLSRKAPGGELVLRLERQHTVEQVRLDRLTRPEVGSLLASIGGGSPSSAAIEAFFRRSGGIPYVVEELVRCCGLDACIDDVASAQLPWSLDDAVRQQLVGLDPTHRSVLDALAVFGDPAPFDVLAAVTELPDDMLMVALRQMVAEGVIVEPSDDRFWFSHALAADAVNQQLLGRQRRQLHARCLEALRSADKPDFAALARHAAGAGLYDQVPDIAREGAGQYLDRGASFQALRLASLAIAEAPDDAELLRVATDAAWRLEFSEEAVQFAHQWRLSASSDLDVVESLRFVARLHLERNEIDERDQAVAELESLSRSLPEGMARGRAIGAIAQILMLMRRPDAGEWAERAIASARLSGDRWLEAQAMVEAASLVQYGGETPAGAADDRLLAAREAARQVGDGVLECRALNNLLSGLLAHSPLAAWARDELRETASRNGFDKLGGSMLPIWEAEAAHALGDMPAMRRFITDATVRRLDRASDMSPHVGHLIELSFEEGRFDEAFALLDQLDDGGDDCRASSDPDMARSVPLRLIIVEHRNDTAAFAAAQALMLRRPFAIVQPPEISLAIDLVATALHAGMSADRVRNEVLGQWLVPSKLTDVVASICEGLLLAGEGRHGTAVAALSAVLCDVSLLYRPIVGTLRTALATSLLADGRRTESLAAVRQVVDVDLARWPGWRRDRAEALLHRLQGSSARPDGDLTSREREVAALVSEGLTNGQLAERLFISPKTAAVHVSNILMKLGVSGRAEIAAWVVRTGMAA